MSLYAEIDEFPGYRFSSDGQVFSRWIRGSKRHRMGDSWHPIKAHRNTRRDYLYVSIRDRARNKRDMRVNVLILWAFTGYRPEGMEAAHKDGNRLDNRVGNLEWKTHAENIADKQAHGTMLRGEQIKNSILTADVVREIKGLIGGVSYSALGRRFGVSEAAIRAIAHGRTWKHVEVA